MPGMMQPQRGLQWAEDGQSAKVSVRSLFSDQVHVRELRMTRDQYSAWQAGDYIQNALPQLSPDEREFLLTGATPEEWDVEFFREDPVTYRGVVSPGETDWRVYVEDEEGSKPLALHLDEVNHSPDGFAWGYSGSGPAQLAYALLRDAVGPNAARSLYGAFKDDKVARWDRSMVWTITSAEVQAWAKSRLHIESR